MMSQSASDNKKILSVDRFLRTILKSGLLSRAELQQTLKTMPMERRNQSQAVADYLIDCKKLTPFQARKLLHGTNRGLVLGPYQIVTPIGRGGMSVVYLARDTRSGQSLALKILPPQRAKEEERTLARFRREMEMCQRVSHPNLAWTYEVGLCDGIYFIAMEHVAGRTLHRLVAEEGPLSVSRMAHLVGEVASALDHAHHQGLIHRDMKPANVMVTPKNHAKVLDFGFAIM